jgi:ribosome-associated translation inhibitor RaiA
MADQLIFHACSPTVKGNIQEYWEQKQRRLQKLLVNFPDDQRNLRVTVRRCPDHYDVHAVLLMPTGTLIAESSSHNRDYLEAIDIVADRLAAEIRRHRQLLQTRQQPRPGTGAAFA